MATNTLSSTIVPELLTNGNYLNWSAWMKNYLLAQDLWDIVEEPTHPPNDSVEYKVWRKKNAVALHALQISSRVDILSKTKIGQISSAKTFWEELAKMYEEGILSNIPASSLSQIVWDKLAPMCGPVKAANNLAGEGSINSERARLLEVINKGDWVAANGFLSSYQDAKSARISDNGGTVLHVAVSTGRTEIVEKLVDLMEGELEITDYNGLTALAQAAILQNTGMVNCMLKKNTYLLNIPDCWGCIPLVTALEYGNVEMARRLYFFSQGFRTDSTDVSTVLHLFILRNNFDLALDLLKANDNPADAGSDNSADVVIFDKPADAVIDPNKYNTSSLVTLAEKSYAFRSGNRLRFWKNWIYEYCIISMDTGDITAIDRPVLGLVLRWLPSNLLKLLGIRQLCEMKLLHRQARELLRQMCRKVNEMNADHVNEAIFKAIKGGIVEFIREIFEVAPQLLLSTIDDALGRDTCFCAVLHRQDEIVKLIIGFNERNSITNAQDKSGSTILHMAAMLEPSTTRDRIAGEALKMQSELFWFKEVERICFPWIKEARNNTNMTPRELFTHKHKDMMEKAEKWMKATANSCTVVGTLIITIMFSAVFTIPGSNNEYTGFPMFPQKNLFTVLIISDALSLVSSSTSVLVFLEILTSRYAEEDFLLSLPIKMIIGLCTLFFSITTMMITFYVGLYIMLPGKSCMVILISCLGSIPIVRFGFTQIPLLFDMLKLTYTVWIGSLW